MDQLIKELAAQLTAHAGKHLIDRIFAPKAEPDLIQLRTKLRASVDPREVQRAAMKLGTMVGLYSAKVTVPNRANVNLDALDESMGYAVGVIESIFRGVLGELPDYTEDKAMEDYQQIAQPMIQEALNKWDQP